jgi:hypothetical protein
MAAAPRRDTQAQGAEYSARRSEATNPGLRGGDAGAAAEYYKGGIITMVNWDSVRWFLFRWFVW